MACSLRPYGPIREPRLRERIVQLARSLIGIPYVYGGREIDGFDCSGLIFYLYDSFGIRLPRTAAAQGKMKKRISLRAARPGDILIFKDRGRWHTALYSGQNRFVHAPQKSGNVRQEEITSYWKARLQWVVSLLP